MIDFRDRIIPNGNRDFPVGSLPKDFVSAITASQIEANKGWAPDNDGLIDRRVVNCPRCGAPGMNTCWGYWAFTCGAEIMPDGAVCEPCGKDEE